MMAALGKARRARRIRQTHLLNSEQVCQIRGREARRVAAHIWVTGKWVGKCVRAAGQGLHQQLRRRRWAPRRGHIVCLHSELSRASRALWSCVARCSLRSLCTSSPFQLLSSLLFASCPSQLLPGLCLHLCHFPFSCPLMSPFPTRFRSAPPFLILNVCISHLFYFLALGLCVINRARRMNYGLELYSPRKIAA